jgi:hypothetical protein
MNTGPLSDRIWPGTPRRMKRSARFLRPRRLNESTEYRLDKPFSREPAARPSVVLAVAGQGRCHAYMTAMLAVGGFALAAWPGTTASQLAAAAFHERFAGQWQGTGTVQRSVDPGPRRVSCGVAGQATEQQIAIGGTCRAAVIVTREIAANLTYDPATGRYVGTYIGSQAGPTRLEGARATRSISTSPTPSRSEPTPMPG